MSNSLSGVMKDLRASVEALKKAVLNVAKDRSDMQVAAYAGDTVTILGEIEVAMEEAGGRLNELEKAGAFTRKVPSKPVPTKTAPPLRRALLEEPAEEEEVEEEPRTYDGPPLEVDEIPDDSEPAELSGEAITAILQHVEASRAHEIAMAELAEVQAIAANPRPGQKRDASLRVAAAQNKVLETWTAKKETYALQELLADRAHPV